jgi:hypothetical protein
MSGGTSASERRGVQRVELRISVARASAEEDLVVDAAVSDRVDELADAVGSRFGEPMHRSLWCERRSQSFDGETPLDGVGIRWGGSAAARTAAP